MEEDSICQQNGQSVTSISALSDFAQIYCFLQRFGLILRLPPITLKDLEDFFISGYCLPCEENHVVYIHWRLLHNVGRSDGRKEWQKMALKLARRNRLMVEAVPYSSLSVEKRMKLFRLACEEQFDYNVTFKNELKKQVPVEALHSLPIGLDYNGRRHWLLKDAVYDVRLYGETDYDQTPPKQAVWVELARSLDELASYIAILDSRSKRGQQNGGRNTNLCEPVPSSPSLPKSDNVPLPPAHIDVQHPSSTSAPLTTSSEHALINSHSSTNEIATFNSNISLESTTPLTSTNSKDDTTCTSSNERAVQKRSTRPRRSSRPSSKGGSKKKPSAVEQIPKKNELEEVEGCMQCHKDVDYKQMLLCDECEKECHTYCQYPRLWTIPEGKWVCPICREENLISELKKVYYQLSEARAMYERTQERKQRSVARLQKSGLLLQNIIADENVDDSSGRRSRRSRKEVNYAELNDVYLPPLGPQDYVGAVLGSGSNVPMSVRTRRMDYYIQEDYLAPRVRTSTRRFRGSPPVADVLTTRPVQDEDDGSPLPISKLENTSDSSSESSTKSVDRGELALDDEMNCDYEGGPNLEKHVRFEDERPILCVPDWTLSVNQDSADIQASSNHLNKAVSVSPLICDRNELAPEEMKVNDPKAESMEHEASNISSAWLDC